MHFHHTYTKSHAWSPSINAKYGIPTYLYSDHKDGTYTDIVPTNVGTWYVKAIVEKTPNYNGLESEAIAFVILE